MTPEEQAAMIAARDIQESAAERAYVGHFDAAWQDVWIAADDRPVPRPRDWERSVRTWRKRGLELEALIALVDQAMNDSRIKTPGVWL